jgi:radical SAM superfamily enzyme YgiQ (UPF0313 family)
MVQLGLCYIGAYLEKNGYEVDLVDLRDLKNFEGFENEVLKRESDIIGIHVNTIDLKYALRCAEIAKKAGKIVVVGGPHATIAPQSLTNIADYIIMGEGEISFLELLRDLERGKKPSQIIYGKRWEKLDELPIPNRSLFNLKEILPTYSTFPYGLTFMASRGCPFNCTFCQPTQRKIFGKTVRYRSIDNIVEEIKYLKKATGVKQIYFMDDTVTINKKWILGLCEKIKEKNMDVKWWAQARVNQFDEEIAKAMSDAGCICIGFGFESGSQTILNFLRKGITVEQSLNAAKLCKKYHMLIFANIMLGIPTETEKDLKATYKLVKEIRPEILSLSYFTPIIGSYLYDYCNEHDLLFPYSSTIHRYPYGKKIKELDYDNVDKYRDKIYKVVPKWYRNPYFAKLVMERWINLAKQRQFKAISRELIRFFIKKFLLKEQG